VGHFITVDLDLSQPSMALRSFRLLSKSGGTFKPVECRGIIAILIGL
jgi:hypothetical protein